MQAALTLQTTVLPGHRIEVAAPDIPEGASVELVIYCLPEKEQILSKTDAPITPYPEALNAEYMALIQTQWQRTLTENEQARLEAIKAEMDALDAASDTHRIWERRIESIRQQLAIIRQEVESLPDAS